jgi:hypothetical protein
VDPAFRADGELAPRKRHRAVELAIDLQVSFADEFPRHFQ